MSTRRDFVLGALGTGVLGAAGARFVLPPGSTERPEARIPAGGCLNVRDFGARGDGTGDDSAAVQSAIDRASAGGGIVFCPAGEYPVAIEVRDRVQVVCDPGTVLRAAGTSSVIRLTGDDTALWNAEVIGSRKEDPSRGLAAHCVEVRGSSVRLENVQSGGARYDSVYVRAGRGVVLRGCRFGPTARNACSVVKGSQIWFEKCEFFQDQSVSSSQHNGLYLYDVEPQGSNQAYGLTHVECTFRTDLRDGYAGVILDARGNRETGDSDVSFYRCAFVKEARFAPSIRIRNGRVYRGLTLVNNTFAGTVLTNNKPIVLSDSILVGNRHSASRFSYNVTLDEVVLVNHRAAGWTGLRVTDATIRVKAP